MVYRAQLNGVLVRVAFVFVLLVTVLGLAWLSSRYFIIRTLADERFAYSQAILSPAIERLPASPKLQKRLIEGFLLDENPDYRKAADYATQAVRLSPRNGKLWYLLAQAQEGQGLSAEAEQSLTQAAALAPADSQINWGLANLLVRVGKVDESVMYFRQAVTLNPSLYPQAFDTLWQAGGRKLEILQTICAANPSAQVSLAQFLIEQKLYSDCVALFKTVAQSANQSALAAMPQTNEMLNQLLAADQVIVAKQLWLLLQPEKDDSGDLWDGGFEHPDPSALSQFNWMLRDSQFARVGYDNEVKRSGKYSLKLLLSGKDTTTLGGEVHQRLALIPGRHYRLEAAVKGEGLVMTEGPRLVVVQKGTPLAQSAPMSSGTWDWQMVSFEFVAPLNSEGVFFDIIRLPKLAYDPPMKGALWIDDVKLRRMEN